MRCGFSLLMLAAAAFGQRVEVIDLKSGGMVIGRVLEVQAQQIVVETADGRRNVARDDVMPVSLYRILAAQADDTAEAHLRLAEEAHNLGLPGYAIAEYQEAARLDPSLAERAEREIETIRSGIADRILEEAQQAIGEKRHAPAILRLQLLVDRYPGTAAAERAKELLPRVRAMRMGAGPLRNVNASQLAQAMDQAGELMQQAEAERKAALALSGVAAQRRLERAESMLERANRLLAVVPPQDTPRESAERLEDMRASVRERMSAVYYELGTLFLSRRALPSAEDYAEKICSIDEESGACHDLQRQVDQARMYSGYWWPVRPAR